MPGFRELDKDFFSELHFHTPPDDELADEIDPTQEELRAIEEELGQWEKMMSSPLGRAIRLFIRSQKAREVNLVMTPVADPNLAHYPPETLRRAQDEAVGSYRVWDYLEKRPWELLSRKMALEKEKDKAPRRKKPLTTRKRVR